MSVRGALGLSVWLAASVASAQTPTARALIDEGRALRRAGRDADAYARFVEAHRQASTPESAGQLGFSEHALSRWADASEHLREALAAAGDGWVVANHRALEFSLAEVARHVGALRVQCDVAGAAVLLDGRAVRGHAVGEAVPVSSGPVTLRIEAEGYVPDQRTVTVAAGETVTTVCRLEPEAAVAGAGDAAGATTPTEPVAPVVAAVREALVPAIPRERGTVLTTLGWVAAGGALTAGAGAALSFILRTGAAARWNDDARCLIGTYSRQQICGSEREDVDRWHTAMVVAGIASGALALTSVILLATSHGPRPARAAWVCAPGLSGVGCAVSF